MRRAQAPSAIGCKGQSVRSLTARYESDMACSDGDIQGGEIGRDKGRRRRSPPVVSSHTQIFDAQLPIRENLLRNIRIPAFTRRARMVRKEGFPAQLTSQRSRAAPVDRNRRAVARVERQRK